MVASCGGLLRNPEGGWVAGFAKFLGYCLVIKSEAWGLLEGLRLAIDIGVELIDIECDFAILVGYIQNRLALARSP